MSEPTIDELLEYLDGIHTQAVEYDADKYAAIFAVIKQHGDADITMRIASIEIEKECERRQRAAIRAFVERVTGRISLNATNVLYDELAAMEKEAE